MCQCDESFKVKGAGKILPGTSRDRRRTRGRARAGTHRGDRGVVEEGRALERVSKEGGTKSGGKRARGRPASRENEKDLFVPRVSGGCSTKGGSGAGRSATESKEVKGGRVEDGWSFRCPGSRVSRKERVAKALLQGTSRSQSLHLGTGRVLFVYL